MTGRSRISERVNVIWGSPYVFETYSGCDGVRFVSLRLHRRLNRASAVATATTPASAAATPYYVDFRTRPDAVNTHTFLEDGAQDSSGHPIEQKTMGFFPVGAGALGPIIGIVGMPGEVGPEDYFKNFSFRGHLSSEFDGRTISASHGLH